VRRQRTRAQYRTAQTLNQDWMIIPNWL